MNSPDVFVSLQELLRLYRNLSLVDRMLRKYGSAIAYARKALNIDPENAKAYFFKAKVDTIHIELPLCLCCIVFLWDCVIFGSSNLFLVNVIMRNFIALYCSSKDISKATKLQVHETMILSTLLYNSETWTLKTPQQNRLKVFEMSCLRKIEGVTRRDHIRNEDIFDRLKLSQDIHSRIQHATSILWPHEQNGTRLLSKASIGRVCTRPARTRATKDGLM